ncbi:MAG: ABC transporter ATP-binding protein [Candidatus Nanopelagicales bacterium]
MAIAIEGLRKDYGHTQALRGLDLEVRTGEVFGFLGPNGAGKTTTIRILLDLIRPSSGTARVLGLDARHDGVALRRRIGYLPGDFLVDGRQSALELLTYLGNLRGGVPRSTITALAERLSLDLGPHIKTLSKGNRQKVGLIQAFMHAPELLILDEPTAGLDPFLQQEFTVMAREVAADGRTVFMSSHVMSEAQKTSDRVGMIREGVLVTVEDVERLLETATREVEIVFAEQVPPDEFQGLEGISDIVVDGPAVRCRLDGRADALIKVAARHTVLSLISQEPDLEEVFFRRYSSGVGSSPTPARDTDPGSDSAPAREARS